MTPNIRGRWLLAFILIIGLYACGAKRVVSPQTIEAERGHGSSIEQVYAKGEAWQAVKSSGQIEIYIRGKSIRSRFNLQAIRGEGIRLSVVPFPLIEAARLWFTKEGVTVVDVINGRYASVGYSEFGAYLGLDIRYSHLEAMFFGGIFTLSGEGKPFISSLKRQPLADGGHELNDELPQGRYSFYLDKQYCLKSFKVTDKQGRPIFGVDYESTDSSILPTLSAPSFARYTLYDTADNEGRKKGEMKLEYRKVSLLESYEGQNIQPIIKESYERIELADLIHYIKNL